MIQLREHEVAGRRRLGRYMVTRPFLPPDHWTLDPIEAAVGSISEGEHFFDICHLLIASTAGSVYAPRSGKMPDDLRTLCNYAVTVHYDGRSPTSCSTRAARAEYPQERVTVLAQRPGGDPRRLRQAHGARPHRAAPGRPRRIDGPQGATAAHSSTTLRGEPSPLLSWDDASIATLTVFAAQESIRTGDVVDLGAFRQWLFSGDGESDPEGDGEREAGSDEPS